MTIRGGCGAACLTLVALLPIGAHAQTPDSLPIPLPGLRITVERQATEEGGAAQLRVPLDTLSPQIAASLEEILRVTPLIRIRRNARGQAQPYLRDGDDRRVAVLLDGVPISLGYDHRADLSTVPMFAARSLTLTRGPAPLAFGPNVTVGAVEVDLSGREPRAAGRVPFRLDLEAGAPASWRVAAQGEGVIAPGATELAMRVGGSHVQWDGSAVSSNADASPFLEGADGLRLASDVRRTSGFAALRWSGEGDGWLGVTALVNRSERGIPPEAHIERPRFWRSPVEEGGTLLASAGTPRIETSVGGLHASLQGAVRTGELQIDDYTSSDYSTVRRTEFQDDRTTTMRGVATLDPTSATRITLGGTVTSTRHLERIDAAPWQRYRQRLWSGSLEAAWRLGPMELDAGLSLDAADTPASGDKPPLERQEEWGVRVGAAWPLSPTLRIHATAGRRARFPSLRELYAGPLARFEPNPTLRPERLAVVEGGATWRRGAAQLQVVAFHQDLADGIVRVTLDGGGPPRFQRRNLDVLKSTGIEFLGSGSWSGVDLRGDASLQHVRGFEDGSERDVEYAPAFAGSVAAGTALPWDVRGEVAARWESSQLCRSPGSTGPDSSSTDEFSNDPAFDLELRRDVGSPGSGLFRSIQAMLRVGNLTDAAVYDQCGLPRPGRTMSIGFRVW